jgi:UDP-N-acetylglucosamine acyltransferase
MASCHIAHDAVIGDGCVLSSGVTLGGHVEIGDGAAVGGLTGIHQFARVGRQAFVGGCSAVDRDVVPFGLAAGNRAQLRNYNSVGLRRLGTSTETLERIRSLFRVLLDRRFNTGQVVSMLETEFDSPESREIVAFIKGSRRGILHGRRHSGQDLAP